MCWLIVLRCQTYCCQKTRVKNGLLGQGSCTQTITVSSIYRCKLWWWFIDRAKRGISSVCPTVCLSGDYGQTSLPNGTKFGINVNGTKAERCIRKEFFCFSPVWKWRPFSGSFSPLRSNTLTDYHDISIQRTQYKGGVTYM